MVEWGKMLTNGSDTEGGWEEEKKKYMRDKGNSWWGYINQK